MSGTLLGFDFGTRRIGVAVGQMVTSTARPLTTLDNRDGGPDWQTITDLVETWWPVALVVGLPFHMDGSEHTITRLARRFGNRLAGRYRLPVHVVDEHLSSVTAQQQLATRQGGHPDKGEVDRIAASVILQTWLDQQGSQSRD